MLASYNWLKEYCYIKQDPFNLAKELTAIGLEVSHTRHVFKPTKHCVVGEITTISPHPNANRLSCVKVNIGREELDIVCGANNLAVGLKVPVALIGASLPGGLTIKTSKIRGQVSNGMLCSQGELGLVKESPKLIESLQPTNSQGIWILPADTALGQPVYKLLPKEDFIFDFDITSNRSDCLSILGLAREISCLDGNHLFSNPLTKKRSSNHDCEISNVDITLDEPERCPRYTTRVIMGVSIADSPQWLVTRLEAHGIRSINNVVDITNYVLIECGQPLHAFDLELLKEKKIIIRGGKTGETFTSLDGKEINLTPEDLVIADGEKPVALAGIIGGKDSRVREQTTAILLECAYFDPESIRTTSKRHRLQTDSSIRFGRQVNIAAISQAIDYATELILKVAGGKIPSELKDIYPVKQKPKKIRFRYEDIEKKLGLTIEKNKVNSIFQKLDIALKSIDGETIQVTVPNARVDLNYEWDLIEEVARLYGYDNIPETLPSITNSDYSIHAQGETVLRYKVQGLGYNQMVNLSFIENKYIEDTLMGDEAKSTAIKIQNPVTVDIAYLRHHLLFGLLGNVKLNLEQHITDNQKIFEIGHVFKQQGDQYIESNALGLLGYGFSAIPNWDTQSKFYTYYDLTQDLRELFDPLHQSKIVFKEKPCPLFSPLASAVIEYNGHEVGIIGLVSPKLVEGMGIKKQKTFYAEIRIDDPNLLPLEQTCKSFSHYPSVYRDFAIVAPVFIDTGAIIDFIKNFDPQIQKVKLTDMYSGEKVGDGKISVVFNIEYQSFEGTLDKKIVDAIEKKLADQIMTAFSVSLR